MSSVHLLAYGKPSEVLSVVPVTCPTTLAPLQVLIRMKLCPINPADVFSVFGVYPGFEPLNFPAVPGLEGMGIVVKVGDQVSAFKKGDRVVPFMFPSTRMGNGSWQEYVVLDQSDVFVSWQHHLTTQSVPDSVSDDAAAQLIVNPATVLGMLKVLNIPKGEFLVQNAAGSTLGRQVIQVAKHIGIKTVNIVRRAAQTQELLELGADIVICSDGLSPEQLGNAIVEQAGKRPFAALDCVAGEGTLALSLAVRDHGKILNFGLMSGLTCIVSGPASIFRGIKFEGYWLAPYLSEMSLEERRTFFKEIFDLLEKKIIVPYSGERFPFGKVKEAIAAANQPGRQGKVLLTSEH